MPNVPSLTDWEDHGITDRATGGKMILPWSLWAAITKYHGLGGL